MQKRPINSTIIINKKKTQPLSPPFFLASTPFLWYYAHLLNVLLDPKVGRFSLPQAERGRQGETLHQVVTITPEGPHWEAHDLHSTGFLPLTLGVHLKPESCTRACLSLS